MESLVCFDFNCSSMLSMCLTDTFDKSDEVDCADDFDDPLDLIFLGC